MAFPLLLRQRESAFIQIRDRIMTDSTRTVVLAFFMQRKHPPLIPDAQVISRLFQQFPYNSSESGSSPISRQSRYAFSISLKVSDPGSFLILVNSYYQISLLLIRKIHRQAAGFPQPGVHLPLHFANIHACRRYPSALRRAVFKRTVGIKE